ncbi:MAG: hypothetical protein IJ007_03870 [Oscillospiraceae bacterium]|nr:hypothetical protein [Oscillospiraceae bacterium]
MYTNGIVIQSYKYSGYKGIDGSGFSANSAKNWYFNYDDKLSEHFEPFYDENIGLTYYDIKEYTHVSVCTDWQYINKYISESDSLGIKYRLLLCQTEIADPIMDMPDLKKEFLGFDYAYANGDNYSAVYNEIPFVFPQFSLNQNGLFNTEKEIREYISQREKFKAEHPPYTLEEGEFVIFKLYELFI